MKRTNSFALLALGAMAALAVFSQADALSTTKTFKEEILTVKITPSPAPLAMHHAAPPAEAATARSVAVAPAIAQLVADPYGGPLRLASSGSAWDVPPSGLMIAQTITAQPTPVPVRFIVKADPNAAYLRIIQHISELDVPYGTTVFSCVFEVFTYYSTSYYLTDWAYGTTSTTQTGTYPMENYPVTSYLSWAAPDFAATFHPYANSGSPGEKVWSGTSGQSQQHCIDLRIVVPNSQSAGTYTATAQYNLIVN